MRALCAFELALVPDIGGVALACFCLPMSRFCAIYGARRMPSLLVSMDRTLDAVCPKYAAQADPLVSKGFPHLLLRPGTI